MNLMKLTWRLWIVRQRRNYSIKKISDYWGYTKLPRCFRCQYSGYLEKAHIIDFAAGGIDDLHNIGLLCYRCHKGQPYFPPQETERALQYFYISKNYTLLTMQERWGTLYGGLLNTICFLGNKEYETQEIRWEVEQLKRDFRDMIERVKYNHRTNIRKVCANDGR